MGDDHRVHEDIRELQDQLNQLRIAFTKDLLEKNKRDSLIRFRNLIKFQRQVNEEAKVPQLPQNQHEIDFEKFDQLKAKLKEQILLMEILIQKEDCPISQVVDPL